MSLDEYEWSASAPVAFYFQGKSPSITKCASPPLYSAGKKLACDSDKPPRHLLPYETDSAAIKRNQTH
jgi:hypothetical protein